ncbi:MAG: hypothetical protein AB1609_12550, partial [Bacillota bacterium]
MPPLLLPARTILKPRDIRVLQILATWYPCWLSARDVGVALGLSDTSASSRAMASLRRLVRARWVERRGRTKGMY